MTRFFNKILLLIICFILTVCVYGQTCLIDTDKMSIGPFKLGMSVNEVRTAIKDIGYKETKYTYIGRDDELQGDSYPMETLEVETQKGEDRGLRIWFDLDSHKAFRLDVRDRTCATKDGLRPGLNVGILNRLGDATIHVGSWRSRTYIQLNQYKVVKLIIDSNYIYDLKIGSDYTISLNSALSQKPQMFKEKIERIYIEKNN